MISVSKSSAPSRRSKRRSAARASFHWWEAPLVLFLLAAASISAIAWFSSNGYMLWFGDAQAHLAIARRIVDSRTPGLDQIGTVWLPLPHLLMLPFVKNDAWWRSGLAGALVGGPCFIIAGCFLYAAVRKLFDSPFAAATAAALFVLNPNVLYLQSTPMTEPVLFAALMALLYAVVSHSTQPSWWSVLLAAAASNAACWTRYEGWFLIPFVSVILLVNGQKSRWLHALVFTLLASLGPLAWFAHNWWYYRDPLEFYHGQYSAKAIYQRALDAGMDRYPGDHDWPKAWLQFHSAATLCAGSALVVLGLAGLITALWRRAFAALLLLALPVAFYVFSIYSSGTPIFVPHLWPNSYYNTRYGLAAFPLLVLAAASLTTIAKPRYQPVLAVLVIFTAIVPWLAFPRAEAWITWKESQVNSEARRAWTSLAAAYLQQNYRPGSGIFSSLGDLVGIYREAGIPLSEILQEGNQPHWDAVHQRPDLFLREEWAVAISGDAVSTTLLKSERRGRPYQCVKIITVKGAPAIEIYRRQSQTNEDTLYQGSRRPE